MLKITVPGDEYFDETTQEFVTKGDVTLRLEHSLVSLSKWESKFEKSFLNTNEKTDEEAIGYVIAMCLDDDISKEVFYKLSRSNYEDINNYIDAKMTATWFNESGAPKSSEVVTAELIYYWLIVFNIPFETETWHLNRLFTLIKICNIKNSKPKKMTRTEIANRNRELNAQRRARMGSNG